MNDNLQLLHSQISARPGWKWLILSTVLLGATMSALDVSIVNVAMPTLKNTFGVSMAAIEWVSMAYMLTLTIFLPLFGRLADLYGRSKLYHAGFVVFTLGSAFCGMATSAVVMIAARVVQAVGAGLLQANSVAIITEVFPARERGKAIGVQGAVQAVSMAVGPFVGGILIATAGWRSIFYVNIPIGVLGTMAALFILPPDSKTQEKKRIDYPGALFFASGLAFLVLAFNEAVKLGWASHTIVMYFLSGAVLLSLFVITELRVEHPLIDLRLFRNSTFLLGNVTGMLSYYVLFAVMFLTPFYMEKVLGYSVALTGSLLTPLLLAMAVVTPFSGHISDKYGSRIMTTSGMLISALACLSFLRMGESVRMPVLIGTMIALGLGLGLFIPSNNSAIMGAAPKDKLGVAGAVLNMMRSLGLILGVDISGVIFTTLEHRYLAEKGYPNVHRIFSNTGIPTPVKADAFMHGFLVVIGVLLLLNLISAFLSAARRVKTDAIIDHDMTGKAVISSGILSVLSQEARGIALLLVFLLFAGTAGIVVSSGWRGGPPVSHQAIQGVQQEAQEKNMEEARGIAMAYYVQKYHDPNVSIEVKAAGDHMEADVSKRGVFVKKLIIEGNTVKEEGTGMRDWLFNFLTNVD
ncbi:MAG TPA: MFS transporter [Dissulfurispiraceae bacterium]